LAALNSTSGSVDSGGLTVSGEDLGASWSQKVVAELFGTGLLAYIAVGVAELAEPLQDQPGVPDPVTVPRRSTISCFTYSTGTSSSSVHSSRVP